MLLLRHDKFKLINAVAQSYAEAFMISLLLGQLHSEELSIAHEIYWENNIQTEGRKRTRGLGAKPHENFLLTMPFRQLENIGNTY